MASSGKRVIPYEKKTTFNIPHEKISTINTFESVPENKSFFRYLNFKTKTVLNFCVNFLKKDLK